MVPFSYLDCYNETIEVSRAAWGSEPHQELNETWFTCIKRLTPTCFYCFHKPDEFCIVVILLSQLSHLAGEGR